MSKEKIQPPKPLTEAEELERKTLQKEIFGDSLFVAEIEELSEKTKRYDELMSQYLTHMAYELDKQVKAERRLMLLN